jgi:hypothetical protein
MLHPDVHMHARRHDVMKVRVQHGVRVVVVNVILLSAHIPLDEPTHLCVVEIDGSCDGPHFITRANDGPERILSVNLRTLATVHHGPNGPVSSTHDGPCPFAVRSPHE